MAQIWFVRTVFQHRLLIRNERKLRRHRLTAGKLLEHAAHYRLDRIEYVLLGDETHFQIELIELARRTVRARILITEAGRDLEVAVETGDHDQLLELLRRLRQRVEFSRVQPRGHEIIACALGRRWASETRKSLVPSCAAGWNRSPRRAS